MTQKEKELAYKDLCARLPYGVKIELTWWDMGYGSCIKTTLKLDHIEQLLNNEEGCIEIKPYLRSVDSMAKGEKEEYKQFLKDIEGYVYSFGCVPEIDWLNAHHFDYRGLIEKGLALEAPDGMYN